MAAIAAAAGAADAPAAVAKQHPYSCDLELQFASPKHAQVAADALAVDQEMSPKSVSRTFTTDGCTMKLHVEAADARFLRLTMLSFFDMSAVVVKTLQEFGGEQEGGAAAR